MATRYLSGLELAHRIAQRLPEAVVDANPEWAEVRPEALAEVCRLLRDDQETDFQFLSCLTAVDRLDHFEVVYHLQSLRRNQLGVLKVKVWDRQEPEVPSVTSVWLGADLQEREAYDLMGIRFRGHPDLRRLFLWEGFPGHPLRKDWLGMPGQRMPGLQRFPGEPGEPDTGRG
jgi:NADH-quinone oxidoreductase subunit C